jgi:hypothetical protein
MIIRLLPLLLIGSLALAQTPPGEKAEKSEKGERPELIALGHVLHGIVVANAPNEFEDRSEWGKTVPIDPKLKFMGLRTTVKVGDNLELPQGPWARSKIVIDDLEKDIRFHVRDLKTVEGGKQRIQVEVYVRFNWEHERKLWNKGIQLGGINAAGNSLAHFVVTCDFNTVIDTSNFPPRVSVDAQVKDTKADLREFELTKLTNIPLVSDAARKYSDEIRLVVQAILKAKEKEITPALNRVLAEVLGSK